jgi:WD40 repeat protein
MPRYNKVWHQEKLTAAEFRRQAVLVETEVFRRYAQCLNRVLSSEEFTPARLVDDEGGHMSRVWMLSIVWVIVLTLPVFGQETSKGVGVRSGDKAADEPVLTLETGGHTAICNWLDFTPDGRTLISLGDDKVVRLWDVSDPASPRLDRSLRLQIGPGHEGKLYAGAVSPDGRWLAVGGFGTPDEAAHWGDVKLLDLTSGEVAAVLRGHSNVIQGLAFSPDGAWLASASSDQTLRVWDVGSVKGELRSEK